MLETDPLLGLMVMGLPSTHHETQLGFLGAGEREGGM